MNFNHWLCHFSSNFDHLNHIRFEDDLITSEEKNLITKSIQQFQRGENSEGKYLIKFAKESSLEDYHETIVHFIREEQRHAMILGKWMKLHHIPLIKHHWVDSVFRNIRRFSGIRNSVNTLMIAEIIAAVYYRALRDCSHSKTLKAICTQILIDESIHLQFQTYSLSRLRRNSQFHQLRQNLFLKFLLAGTVIIVWKEHKKVLKEGGYNFRTFNRECYEILAQCIQWINDELTMPLASEISCR